MNGGEKRKVRILEAFGEPIGVGGQESFVFGMIEKIDMAGISIDCLTAYDCKNVKYKKFVESKGGKIYTLNLPFTPGKSRNNIYTPFYDFLKDHSYDVVHIHSGSISVLAIMARIAEKAEVRKIIVHSHATGDRDSLKHKILRFIASKSMKKNVDIYCACSKAAAEWKFVPEVAEKTIIIRNGINTERFRFDKEIRNIMRQKLNIPETAFVLGHVGRFSKEKNHEFLINIFLTLSDKKPDSYLILVGDGALKSEMQNKIRMIKNRVIFTGSVLNVQDYLQAMDVFLLPSLYEGLGIVAIEAQCTGLPIVASDQVPQDIQVCEEVVFLSLDEETDYWADHVSNYSGRDRQDKSIMLQKAGYDIRKTAEIVRNIYLSE